MPTQNPPADGDRARTVQGERSRVALLNAAVDLISERGYAGTSVGDVCKRAGVAKTALYWHFENKEGLLTAVVERVGTTWIEEIQKSVYLTGNPLERIDRLAEAWRTVLVEQPQLLRLLGVVLYERSGSEPTREVLFRVWRRAVEAIIAGIEDTIGGTLPDLDLVAHTALALMQGAMMRLLMDPASTDLDRLFAEFRRTLLLVVADRVPADRRPDWLPAVP